MRHWGSGLHWSQGSLVFWRFLSATEKAWCSKRMQLKPCMVAFATTPLQGELLPYSSFALWLLSIFGLGKRKIPTFPGRACLNPKPSGIILLEPFAICPFGCGLRPWDLGIGCYRYLFFRGLEAANTPYSVVWYLF